MVDGKLWIALQANVLSDLNDTSVSFKKQFNAMMSNLENFFVMPKLKMNMRNSEKINKASHGVTDRNLMYYKISDIIEKLPPLRTTSLQEEPILVPVHENDFESNFKNMFDEKILDLKKKTLIIHTKHFNGYALKSLLIKNFPEIKPHTVLQHDYYPNNASIKDLQSFLLQPEPKIGIFNQKFVTGMEGSNVVYFHDANHISDVRCAMTRAVSNLCIILRFTDDEYPTTFNDIKINKNFIECKEIFGRYESYYNCPSCNTKQICVSCLIGCHQQHPIEQGGHVDDERVVCDCKNSNCFIQTD